MENRPFYPRGRARGNATQPHDRTVHNNRRGQSTGMSNNQNNNNIGIDEPPRNRIDLSSRRAAMPANPPETQRSGSTLDHLGATSSSGANYNNSNNRKPIPNSNPSFWGSRGRGSNSYHSGALASRNVNQTPQGETEKAGEKIFQAAAAAHKEMAERHLRATEEIFSDDDEDDEDESEDLISKQSTIMSSILSGLGGSSSVPSETLSREDLGRTATYIDDAMRTRANICLICLETVKKENAIWNCNGCFAMFHLQCIQQWIRDGTQQKSLLSRELFPNQEQPWFCPKCRHSYQQSDFPKNYLCFCKKTRDPPSDHWILPHSCGEKCGKPLSFSCSHVCLLLCHPGPCPPCPMTVKTKCFCGRASEQIRRCGLSKWSCGSRCDRPLKCGHHKCPAPCHEGLCGECPEKSEQYCLCRKKRSVVPCSSLTWRCDEVCDKSLSCGHHKCQVECHSGQCPPCPKSGRRTCPCGKTKVELPCTEEVPTCLETCGKQLDCGKHSCTDRCHQGPCGVCREMTKKKCQCGKREKEVQCCKEFACETKCLNYRNCGVHQCKRKCCDNNCLPCTTICNKLLTCRQHRCVNTCHTGPCYPCTAQATLKCNCGKTVRTVPCGAEKKTRPPRCAYPCLIPPSCHHSNRTPHPCHFGDCPPCKQQCSKQFVSCSHSCKASCHSSVRVKVRDNQPRVGPWEVNREVVQVVSQACPPCPQPVPVTCFGKHETAKVRCCDAKPFSCFRSCGRTLPCSNHACQLPCHVVEGAAGDGSPNKAGTNCQSCEEPCSKPRPPGCNHLCLLPCHPDDCPPCSQMIRMRCHCQMVVRHISCRDWCQADKEDTAVQLQRTDCSNDRKLSKDKLQSCSCPCPKFLPCSHQCKQLCHPGDCPPSPDCEVKVKVRCSCGRRREELECQLVQKKGAAKLECNKACELEKENARKEKEAEDKIRAEQEALKKKEELEEFEKRTKQKKKKQRRRNTDDDDDDDLSFFKRHQMSTIMSVFVLLFAVFFYKLVLQ